MDCLEKGEINDKPSETTKLELLVEISMKLIDATLHTITMSDFKRKLGSKIHYLDCIEDYAKKAKLYKMDIG